MFTPDEHDGALREARSTLVAIGILSTKEHDVTTSPLVPFNDGHSIPQLGYGVWQVDNDVAADVVQKALEAGYRHIDTAKIYGNEEGVGRAIKASGIDRDELFVTTKLWNTDQPYDKALAAIDTSLEKLGLDHVDLYLIHRAARSQGTYLEAWKALVEIQKQGKATSIGVSNFPIPQLDEIIDATGVVPAIHQFELHPDFQQKELVAYGKEHGIVTESYSPLGSGSDILDNEVIAKIAEEHGASAGQVILAWHLAQGYVTIPKSVTPSRIVENYASLNVELTADDLAKIADLDLGGAARQNGNPEEE
jgi:2,5-diketo-D-gluconate reductase A